MKIYFNDTQLDIEVNDNSYRYRAIKGEHTLTLYFSLPQHVEIPVGAWCEFEAETYTLEAPENFKMHNSRNFEYTLVMESAQAKLRKYKLRNMVDGRLKFEITCKPKEHVQMLVDNLNARDSGWRVGGCVDSAEKVIAYNHAFCDAALSQMADAFETEWEIVGKTIHLRKVEYNKDNPLPLSYGRGNGFKPGVGRTNFNDSRPVEVLFVQGGDRNIDASKYGSKELLLPKNQTLEYEGRVYVSDSDGVSIRRSDTPLKSQAEESLDLSHIYPSRVEGVTSVVVVDKSKNFYDIIDDTIPADLDFAKCLIEGETMSIIFQSGMLAGKEFEVKYCHEAKTINGVAKAARRFEIVPQDIDGQPMPNDTFAPQVGDKYAVFGMMLPDAYVCDNATKTGASWELFKEGAKYLYEHEEQKFTFTGELDGIWAKKDWLNIGGRIKLGGYVLFSDPQFQIEGIGIRIVGIKDYINNPHSPEIELSNSVVGSSIMSDLRKIESNEVLTDSQHKEALQFTKRRFRDAKETIKMLEETQLNFSGSVTPVSVQTMQLLLGDESLQYRFVASLSNPKPITHEVLYAAETKILTAKAGVLQHLTLGVKTLSSSHAASEYKCWEMPLFDTPPLTDPAKSYYLYAKVSKSAQTGVFRISETAIGMEEAGYYHLLVGVLNSEYNADRSFVPLYGFAELTPGRLTIPRIVSADGKTYFDLERGEIGGRITFTSSDGESQDVAEAIGQVQADANDAKEQIGQVQADVDTALGDAKEQIANDLGYTDYAAMQDAKTGKQTIINGGMIRTSLLDVDNIVARQVNVVSGNSAVTITPKSGMRLLENNIATAIITGEQVASIVDKIAPDDTIQIQRGSSRPYRLNDPSDTTTLCSGVVIPTTKDPVITVEIPEMVITAHVSYQAEFEKEEGMYAPVNIILSSPLTTITKLRVNGVVKGTVSARITEAYLTEEEGVQYRALPDTEIPPPIVPGHHIYIADKVQSLTIPSQTIEVSRLRKTITVTLETSFTNENPNADYPHASINGYGEMELASGAYSEYLKLNGRSLGGALYGNGLVFSKTPEQYVGMASTKEGSELVVRSGEYGLKVDKTGVTLQSKTGISQLKHDGTGWDNAGLLCGYQVYEAGGFALKFGVKDRSDNGCVRTATGNYRLTHNIGHTNYVVSMVIATAGWEFCNIAGKYANYVDIEIHGAKGEWLNRPFMITFFGKM